MRASSFASWFVVVAASLSGCTGDSFSPPPGGSNGGSAGTSTGGAGTGTAGANGGGKGGSSPGKGGTSGDAGATNDAGSGGSQTKAGAGGTIGQAGTGTDGGSGGATPGAGAGGTGDGGKDGKGGQSGANAGGKGGGAGTGGTAGKSGTSGDGGSAGDGGKGGSLPAGSGGTSAGSSGVSGGAGAAGSAPCTRLPTCGDTKLSVSETCDITACGDAYCAPDCQRTDAVVKLRATELCVGGVCWMLVDTQASSRNGGDAGTGSCKKLDADGRVWSLAWFATEDEKKALLVAAPQFLPIGSKLTAAWIAPVYEPGAGWTQPEAPVGTMPPPLDPPSSGAGAKVATKVQVKLGSATIVTSDPSSGDALVLCRANN